MVKTLDKIDKTVGSRTVRIRFLDTHKFHEVDNVPGNIEKGEFIVIETEKGEELVLIVGFAIPDRENPPPYKFLRKATKKDIQTFDKHEKEAEGALLTCKRLAEKLGLKMNLLKAYIPLNRSKIMFYYVSEGRVDFRQLVRELAKRLKMRIEMRQVGVRDGVQMFGAVGVCGNECCCSLFMDKFDTVNVEMLEEQNLPPTPAKFTGVCGRLMCCLAFETENYVFRKNLPEIDAEVEINGKVYRVKRYDFIREFVEFTDLEGIPFRLTFDEVKNLEIKVLSTSQSACSDCSVCNNENFSNFQEEKNGDTDKE